MRVLDPLLALRPPTAFGGLTLLDTATIRDFPDAVAQKRGQENGAKRLTKLWAEHYSDPDPSSSQGSGSASPNSTLNASSGERSMFTGSSMSRFGAMASSVGPDTHL